MRRRRRAVPALRGDGAAAGPILDYRHLPTYKRGDGGLRELERVK